MASPLLFAVREQSGDHLPPSIVLLRHPERTPARETAEIGVVARVVAVKVHPPATEEVGDVALVTGEAPTDRFVVQELGVGRVEDLVARTSEPEAEVHVVEGHSEVLVEASE